MRTKAILFHILLILIPTFGLAAEESQARTALPDVDAGQTFKDPLLIAIDRSYRPQTFLDVDGQPTGIFVDIWRLWSQKTGKDIKFITGSWKDTLTNLKNGKADIHSGLFYSDSRAEWIKFSQPFYGVGSYLFLKAGSKGIDSRGDLAGKKIGATSGSFQEEYLRKKYPKAEVVPFTNREEMIRAVLAAKIDALLAEAPSMTAILGRLGLAGQFQTSRVLFNKSFHAGVLKENNALLLLIDKGFDTISNRELAEIEKRWIPDPHKQYFKASRARIRLTEKEKAWINEHSPIRVGFPWNFPPLFFKEDGTIKGINPDYLRLVSSYSGLQFDFVSIPSNWEDLLRTGEIDMTMGFDIPARKTFSRNTLPFMDLTVVVAGPNDMPLISGLNALNGKKTAVIKGAKIYNQILKNYPGIEHYPADTFKEALAAVASGKADNVMAPMVMVGYLLHDYPTLKILGLAGIPPTPYMYTVRKDFPELVSILNKALTAIPKAEKDAIVQEWFRVQIEHKTDWSIILRWIGGISLVFLLVLCIFFYWNKRLVKQITDRKRAEEALRESEEKYRSLTDDVLDNSAVGIFILNSDFRVVWVNQSLEGYFGLKRDEIIGKDKRQLIRKRIKDIFENPDGFANKVFSTYDDNTYIECFQCHVLPDGERQERWLEHQSYPIQSGLYAGGRIEHYYDVTAMKQAQGTLRESEEKYRTTLRSTPDTVAISCVEDGRFLELNDGFTRMFGYSREEAIGKTVTELDLYLAHTDRDRLVEALSTQEEANELEFTYRRKDGTLFKGMQSARPIRFGDEDCLISVVKDISSLDTAQKALGESEGKYRSLFEQAGDYILMLEVKEDVGLVIADANEAACEIHGYTREELIGTPISDIDRGLNNEQVRALLDRVMAGESLLFETKHLKKDGTTFPIEVSSKYLDIGEGPPLIISIERDLTNRKRAEEERKKLKTQLQQAQKMEAMGTLAGGIAHDFNNLLMAIQGRASIMLMKKDSSHPDIRHLKGIEDNVESAADLTKQLLGFARGGKYEVKTIDINELIKKQNRMFGRTKKEITIRGKYEENLWSVEVDRGQIEQVLLNLYVNAWQAMPGGGHLYLETENVTLDETDVKPFSIEPGKYVKISVTDTGVGMDKATLEKIFEPFFTTKEMGRGTGLGLASAYGIIKNHGGCINVYGEKGHGTTFNIYLPASEKEVIEEKAPAGDTLRGTETVLFVDDEDMIIEIAEEMFEQLGYKVLIARSGKEAIETYEKNKDNIDIVLLDMIMPDMSGSDTYDSLKEIDSDIRVLLSSGYSLEGRATEILDRGCNGFIQKPFKMKELSQKLRGILDKK